jgi:hypothetical protein
LVEIESDTYYGGDELGQGCFGDGRNVGRPIGVAEFAQNETVSVGGLKQLLVEVVGLALFFGSRNVERERVVVFGHGRARENGVDKSGRKLRGWRNLRLGPCF